MDASSASNAGSAATAAWEAPASRLAQARKAIRTFFMGSTSGLARREGCSRMAADDGQLLAQGTIDDPGRQRIDADEQFLGPAEHGTATAPLQQVAGRGRNVCGRIHGDPELDIHAFDGRSIHARACRAGREVMDAD